MDVSNLREFIASLSNPLKACGASKVAIELGEVLETMSRFDGMSLKDWCRFLEAAHHYRETGEVPVPSKGGSRRTPQAKPPKLSDAEQIQSLAKQIGTLLERSADEGQSFESLAQEMDQLLKKPTKGVVLGVAKELHLTTPFKTKKEAVDELIRLVYDRKQTQARTSF